MSDVQSGGPPGGARRSGALPQMIPSGSVGLKLILVCALALLMSIPAFFVYGVSWERSSREAQAVGDVSERYGGEQTLVGPFLVVPFSRTPDPNRPDTITYGHAIAFAERGAADGVVDLTLKRRGLYQVPVFEADVSFDAEFDPQALRDAVPADATAFWADARIHVGLSDNRGVRAPFDLSVDGRDLSLEPVSGYGGAQAYSISPHADVRLAAAASPELETASGPLRVRAGMKLSGAGRLAVAPFAKTTNVKIDSDWTAPSFEGAPPKDYEPAANEGDRFEAAWSTPYLARGVAGAGANLSLYDLTNTNRVMGVRFVNETSPYQSVQRALKYAVLFIGLVFLAYFLLEVASRARAHPAQYVLVGLAQTIFYLLLLAFAERVGFDIAFLGAAGATIALTSLYAASVFGGWRFAGLSALVLSGIYGLSYLLMRAEDLALMAGACASFAAIAITMWATRRVDWYGGRYPA